MKIKVGRNAPCPCGSGKKYKNCCLKKAQPGDEDLLYKKLREVHDQLVYRLLEHGKDLFGPEVILMAWDEFIFFEDEKYDFESLHNPLFYPWMLYSWVPPSEFFEFDDDLMKWEDHSIAESFAEKYQYQISEIEKRFIYTVSNTPFSFYEILECQPGIGFKLKEIFTDEEIDVKERMGSKQARETQIVFARVIQYDSVGMIIGSGAFYFPPSYKINILELKEEMLTETGTIDEDDLFDWSEEIRMLYFSLYDLVSTPPQMTNTDGDPLILHELYYEIESPETVFAKLKSLAVGVKKEELLSEAVFDKNGNLQEIEFPWLKLGNVKMKEWKNTVLGHIKINKNRMTINVNSKNRAKTIKRKIKTLLGNLATYKTTKIQSPDSLLEQSNSEPFSERSMENEELMAEPEVKKLLEESLEKHWENWIHDKIPILGNKTPFEMVKNKNGREKVKALLDEFDIREENVPPHLKQKKYIDSVRKKLGLD